MSLIDGDDSHHLSNNASSWPNISEWVANAIADTGTRVVYGGHGGALVPMVNAVCAHPLLQWVSTRNEHDAAEMAAAHAKLTGGLGVVIATSGPGATVSTEEDSSDVSNYQSEANYRKTQPLLLFFWISSRT
jgi:Thiamine pyrophosphate enzyme, N-terminal TPP binding domain